MGSVLAMVDVHLLLVGHHAAWRLYDPWCRGNTLLQVSRAKKVRINGQGMMNSVQVMWWKGIMSDD